MARQKGSMNISGTIEPKAGGPLDARSVVPTLADLTTASNFPYAYVGMETYVTAENKKYRLTSLPVTTASNWEEIGTGGSGDSIQVSELPTPSASNLDDILQYVGPTGEYFDPVSDSSNWTATGTNYSRNYLLDEGKITLRCIDGNSDTFIQCKESMPNKGVLKITRTHTAGNAINYVGFRLGTTKGGNDLYEATSWGATPTIDVPVVDEIDLSQYNSSTIYLTFRINVAATNNVAYEITKAEYIYGQYPYINGHFYQCVSDDESTPTYSWEEKAVQDNGPTLPAGGTSGQLLSKRSGNDYDVEWIDQSNVSTYSKSEIDSFLISISNGLKAYLLTLRGVKNKYVTLTDSTGSTIITYHATTDNDGFYTGLFYFHDGATISITYDTLSEPITKTLSAYVDSVDLVTLINLVPQMTSNTAPKGVASASSQENNNHQPFHAFTRNNGQFWGSSGNSSGQWISYQFASSVIPIKVKWYPLSSSQIHTTTCKIQIWDVDNSTWVDATSNFSFTTTSSTKYAGENSILVQKELTNTFSTTKLRIYFASTGWVAYNAGMFQILGYET